MSKDLKLSAAIKKVSAVPAVMIVIAFILSACGSQTPAATSTSTSAADLLTSIQTRGTLVVATDPAYPPQSALKASPQRTPDSKCATDQKTMGELEGFDIDVAAGIAKNLGVEPCFVTPDWNLITAGNWAGRWDISIGSMTITPERAKTLYFAQPYYTTPAALFVYKDNTTYTRVADLSGKKIGSCGGCTYESFLNGTLVIPGETLDFSIKDAVIKTYDDDGIALEDLSLGDGARLDAVLTAQPTGQLAVKNGKPVKQLGDALFFEYLAPAIDRHSALDPQAFLAKVTGIIAGLHKDGSLTKLSMQYYGTDLTSAAATFDASAFGK